jgi:hypothetical protein
MYYVIGFEKREDSFCCTGSATLLQRPATSCRRAYNPANTMTGRHGIGRESGGWVARRIDSREVATP